jgi:hypothetical protein
MRSGFDEDYCGIPDSIIERKNILMRCGELIISFYHVKT